MKKYIAISAAIILISFVIGIYLYPQMPETMASHWDAQGQVNGYMPKFWGTFLMPIISVFMLLLFIIIPRLDPLNANIKKFEKYYGRFIVLLISFLFYIYCLTLLWSMDIKLDITRMILPAFAILFYYVGILTEHAKKNWFIGIRTPWTLSNDKVWDKTHKLGGKLFKIAAVFSLFGILFYRYAFLFVIVPVLIVVVYTLVYSYVEYKKIVKK